MLLHRLLRRWHPILILCLFGNSVSYVAAQNHVPGTSQLGGFVYIDRNNDGVLAFSTDPHPEFMIGDVEIRLFSQVGNTETLVRTAHTDEFGRYFFNGLSPGTYALRQTQPIEFVDGLDTAGTMASLNLQPVPGSASTGQVSDNAFTNIVLPANVRGDMFNFGERGLGPGYVSKRFLLGSAPPLPTTDPPEDPVIPEPSTVMLATIALFGHWIVRGRCVRSR